MAWPAAIGGHCGEVIANLDTAGNDASRVARVDTEGSCIVEPYPSGQFAGLVNLFVCEGAPGPVLEVEVKESSRTLRQPPKGSARCLGASGSM